jgi:hypothetical protein
MLAPRIIINAARQSVRIRNPAAPSYRLSGAAGCVFFDDVGRLFQA